MTGRDLVALPKAHLHVHLESTIRPATLAELGDVPALPPVFAGFGAFADYNAAVRACLRTAAVCLSVWTWIPSTTALMARCLSESVLER